MVVRKLPFDGLGFALRDRHAGVVDGAAAGVDGHVGEQYGVVGQSRAVERVYLDAVAVEAQEAAAALNAQLVAGCQAQRRGC